MIAPRPWRATANEGAQSGSERPAFPVRHLFVTQDYAPDLGGMARRHVEVCRRLAQESVTVSAVAATDGGVFDRGESYVIRRQPFGFSRSKRTGNRLRWARDVAALAREHDIIHAGNIRGSGYATWWGARKARVPYLLYVNGGDLLREKRKAKSLAGRLGCRRVLADASGIVATSRWVEELSGQVMQAVGVHRPPPIKAFDLGTDPRWFHPNADTGALRARWRVGAAPLMITIARLVPHKGQDAGIRALQKLRAEFPELRYVIVGAGGDEERLRDLARELSVTDHVVFPGVLHDSDLPEAYCTSTVYLGLSRVEQDLDAEGFGISFIEASACALPIVAGDSGGVRSAVRDGETGVVVPPTNVDAVAAAVASFLRDEDLRRRFGRAGRVAVETHYNWDRVARDTREFAREVVRA